MLVSSTAKPQIIAYLLSLRQALLSPTATTQFRGALASDLTDTVLKLLKEYHKKPTGVEGIIMLVVLLEFTFSSDETQTKVLEGPLLSKVVLEPTSWLYNPILLNEEVGGMEEVPGAAPLSLTRVIELAHILGGDGGLKTLLHPTSDESSNGSNTCAPGAAALVELEMHSLKKVREAALAVVKGVVKGNGTLGVSFIKAIAAKVRNPFSSSIGETKWRFDARLPPRKK